MGGQVERGELIARLWDLPHECRARWRHPGQAAWDIAFVAVGQLGDGRWYVDHTQHGTRAYPDKRAAWFAARSLMSRREGGWERVRCYPTPEPS